MVRHGGAALREERGRGGRGWCAFSHERRAASLRVCAVSTAFLLLAVWTLDLRVYWLWPLCGALCTAAARSGDRDRRAALKLPPPPSRMCARVFFSEADESVAMLVNMVNEEAEKLGGDASKVPA